MFAQPTLLVGYMFICLSIGRQCTAIYLLGRLPINPYTTIRHYMYSPRPIGDSVRSLTYWAVVYG